MKAILTSVVAFLTLVLSTFSNAHEYGFSEQCDVQINADVELKDEMLFITLDNGDKLRINSQGETWRNNKALSLNDEQGQLTKQYYNQINTLVPQAMALASDAIAIANTALTDVFSGLFGENSEFVETLQDTLSGIESELREKVYRQDGSVQFGRAVFDRNGSFSESLEAQIDEAVEGLVSQAMGEMMMLLGKAMLSGDTDMSDFEQRMESVGDNLDSKLEQHSADIEASAEELCESIHRLDETENNLQKSKSFSDFDLIHLKQRA